MALKIKQLPLPRSPQRSSARRLPIRGTVSHHMTVIGRGDGLANEACRGIWRTRQASAHYGVDGTKVAQFLDDHVAAWATANVVGNHAYINIEHANLGGGPQWRIAADTLDTGAQLIAELHHKHHLGRPVMNVTMKRHVDFFPTACPGPWFGDSWAAYCALTQHYYDHGTNDTPVPPLIQEDDMAVLVKLNHIAKKAPVFVMGPGHIAHVPNGGALKALQKVLGTKPVTLTVEPFKDVLDGFAIPGDVVNGQTGAINGKLGGSWNIAQDVKVTR